MELNMKEIKRFVTQKQLQANIKMNHIEKQLMKLSPEDIKEVWYYFLILPHSEWVEKYYSSKQTIRGEADE